MVRKFTANSYEDLASLQQKLLIPVLNQTLGLFCSSIPVPRTVPNLKTGAHGTGMNENGGEAGAVFLRCL